MRLAFVSAALLAAPALAFRDTAPFLIWSSKASEALAEAQAEISSGVIAAEEIYGTVSSLGCDWNTLVVGHVDGLHHSRVKDLSLPRPNADLHIPYLVRPSKETLNSAVDEWAKICGAESVSEPSDVDGKSVLTVDLKEGDDISSIVSSVAEPYILILTGSNPISKREVKEVPLASSTTSRAGNRPSSTATSTSLPSKDGPLLERVQLLTTPVITALLISFFILLPILYFGISALVAIQVPPRLLEISKTSVSKDKKDQ